MTPRNSPTKNSGLKIADVMTKPVITVTPQDSVGHAHRVLLEHNIRQLPVLEAAKLVGVITDRDIRSLVSGHTLLDPEAMAQALNTPVRDVMTVGAVTVSSQDNLQAALILLVEAKFGGIPVVDKRARLCGIVTYIDLLRCFLDRLSED